VARNGVYHILIKRIGEAGLNNNNEILIIYPNEAGTIDPKDMLFCEKFISLLSSSSHQEIKLKIYLVSKHVESNDANIKNFVGLMLGAKQLDDFYKRFIRLLHRIDTVNSEGFLKLVQNNTVIKYLVIELKPAPEFEWKIERMESTPL
jgi:hypothetical protein